MGTESLPKELDNRETLLDKLTRPESSPLRNYQELFVGGYKFFDLLKYELLTFSLSSMPGALGFFLRGKLYPLLLGQCGKGTIFGSYMTMRCPSRIFLGQGVYIDDNVVLDAKGNVSKINIGDSVLIGRNSIFSCLSATIDVENDVSIGPHCYIRAGIGPIQIGSQVTVGSHTVIISGNPDYKRLDVPMKKQIGSVEGIAIGNDVWIGVGVSVIDGVVIGDGSVIGAGAVVVENVPEHSIAAGVPARIIGSRST